MVFPNRGNPYTAPVRATDIPYQRFTPLPAPKVHFGIPPAPAAKPAAPAPKLEFLPWDLHGPQTVTFDRTSFGIPAHALLKRKGPICWVNLEGHVFALTREGTVVMDSATQSLFDRNWSNI